MENGIRCRISMGTTLSESLLYKGASKVAKNVRREKALPQKEKLLFAFKDKVHNRRASIRLNAGNILSVAEIGVYGLFLSVS